MRVHSHNDDSTRVTRLGSRSWLNHSECCDVRQGPCFSMLTSDVLVIIATLLCGWLLWLFMGPSMDVPAKEGAAAINMEQMVRDNAAAEVMMAKLVASDVHAVLSTGGNRGTCSECGGLPKQGPPPKSAVGKLLACAGCQAAWYCDKTCQSANWKKHKKDLVPVAPPTLCLLCCSVQTALEAAQECDGREFPRRVYRPGSRLLARSPRVSGAQPGRDTGAVLCTRSSGAEFASHAHGLLAVCSDRGPSGSRAADSGGAAVQLCGDACGAAGVPASRVGAVPRHTNSPDAGRESARIPVEGHAGAVAVEEGAPVALPTRDGRVYRRCCARVRGGDAGRRGAGRPGDATAVQHRAHLAPAAVDRALCRGVVPRARRRRPRHRRQDGRPKPRHGRAGRHDCCAGLGATVCVLPPKRRQHRHQRDGGPPRWRRPGSRHCARPAPLGNGDGVRTGREPHTPRVPGHASRRRPGSL
eukprot:m.113149 g.113149  ORF g.113149 m.113149 type:complete len:470 (-) comp21452_c0_seq8:516-1925(-)